MKKIIQILCLLTLLSPLALVGVEVAHAQDVETLTLGVMPSVDNIPLLVAKKQGFDKKHGVNLSLEVFRNANDRDTAFQAKQVDGMNSDLIAFATYLEGGMDIQITGSTFGEFDLVVNDDDVKTLADLKDKKVAVLTESGTQYSAEQMLKEQNVQGEEVHFEHIPPVPSRIELLRSHELSGAILPEPFVTMAKEEGMRVLSTTREIGINPFIMVFERETIETKQEAIRGMYEAYNEAVDYLKTANPEEYMDLFVEEIGFPETLKDKIHVPDYTKAEQTSLKDIEQAFQWARDHDILTKDIKPEDVLSHVYFK